MGVFQPGLTRLLFPYLDARSVIALRLTCKALWCDLEPLSGTALWDPRNISQTRLLFEIGERKGRDLFHIAVLCMSDGEGVYWATSYLWAAPDPKHRVITCRRLSVMVLGGSNGIPYGIESPLYIFPEILAIEQTTVSWTAVSDFVNALSCSSKGLVKEVCIKCRYFVYTEAGARSRRPLCIERLSIVAWESAVRSPLFLPLLKHATVSVGEVEEGCKPEDLIQAAPIPAVIRVVPFPSDSTSENQDDSSP